jgi:hypothetical protein
MSLAGDLPTPSMPRPDRGTRFWELPVPLAVLRHCAGNALMLAAWLSTAAILLEDEALRGVPRPAPDLLVAVAQQLGIEHQPSIIVTSLLVALEERQLLAVSNAQIVIPWAALAETSVNEAQQQLAAADALVSEVTARLHQNVLPGIETV